MKQVSCVNLPLFISLFPSLYLSQFLQSIKRSGNGGKDKRAAKITSQSWAGDRSLRPYSDVLYRNIMLCLSHISPFLFSILHLSLLNSCRYCFIFIMCNIVYQSLCGPHDTCICVCILSQMNKRAVKTNLSNGNV